MFKIKKLSYSLLALTLTAGVASTAQASYNGGYARCGGWYVSAEPFYERVTDTLFSRLSYSDTSFFDTSVTGNRLGHLELSDRYNSISQDDKWGFRVAVGYDFPSCNPCNNYGASLEYTHFNAENSNNTDASFVFNNTTGIFSGSIITPLISPLFNAISSSNSGIDVIGFTEANASFRTNYDTVDLLAHKNIFLRNCSTAQFFVGARYLHLKEEYRTNFEFPGFVGTFDDVAFSIPSAEDHLRFNNKFDGIGPRIGANAFYNIAGGFGVTGELAGELLFGQVHSDFSENLSVAATTSEFDIFSTPAVSDEFRNDQHDTNIVVPGLSGKVGLAFRTSFCNCTTLSIELGYRGDKYFGVADNAAFTESLNNTVNTIKDAKFHDVSFTGPYLSVTVHA